MRLLLLGMEPACLCMFAIPRPNHLAQGGSACLRLRQRRGCRQGDWKYLQVDGNDYLFNITEDARERANRAKVEPARLDAMKHSWLAWNDNMPAIPADAEVKLGYSTKDMPQR